MKKVRKKILFLNILIILILIVSSTNIINVAGRKSMPRESNHSDENIKDGDSSDDRCYGHKANATCPPGEEDNQPLGPCLTWGSGADFGKMHEGKTFRWGFNIGYSTYPEDEKIVGFSLEIQYTPNKEKWLKINPKSGVLTQNKRNIIGDILVDTTGLSPGIHTAIVHINSEAPSAAEKAGYSIGKYIKYTVTILPSGAKDKSTLQYSPLTLFYNLDNKEDGQKQTFNIWNSGEGVLKYTLFTAPECPWISISNTTGVSTGEKDSITVTVNPSKKECGKAIMAYIYIRSNGGERGNGRNVDYGSKARSGDAVGYILVRRTSKSIFYDLNENIKNNKSSSFNSADDINDNINSNKKEEENNTQEQKTNSTQDPHNQDIGDDKQQNRMTRIEQIMQKIFSRFREFFQI